MKIGILTFHWATNYGAVLQSYALQTYLENLGHTVEIIDYKPDQYDDTLSSFIRARKFLHFSDYLKSRKKEFALVSFRNNKLKKTRRYRSLKEMLGTLDYLDVLISGSDQVLNPFFLLHGEGQNIESPTYFLGFPFEGKKIGYAVSFGCVEYPSYALPIASKYINAFDAISVREKTGIDIVSSFGRDDAVLVPDPTLLINSDFYHKQAEEVARTLDNPYIYSFFIRHISSRKSSINSRLQNEYLLWNNEDGDYSIQGWLSKIKHANYIITDSFHCVVMCLKLHKPFIVVVEEKGNVGMNDRLYTLLEPLGLTGNLLHKDKLEMIVPVMKESIDWEYIDKELNELKLKGQTFLNSI